MSKTVAERATHNVKVLMGLINTWEEVNGRNNFTADEIEKAFVKANDGDTWIDGCCSVEEFLENLFKLHDLDCEFVPSAVYFLPKKKRREDV
ncbi:MAG: hypothetical protein UT37_C0007G0020 [Parcubacteria group bacterium GW2011_GWA2_39_18]|nr:MAG: hypothetical protein UT37_C0007G0020 [Parcubacteria group bacterium GW2011_GWA2_39_18]